MFFDSVLSAVGLGSLAAKTAAGGTEEGIVLIRDSSHAEKMFDSPEAPFDPSIGSIVRAGSHKHQFAVVFNFDTSTPQGKEMADEVHTYFLTTIVRSVGDISFEMKQEAYKGYNNKKNYFYTGIEYQPVTITFSDSRDAQARRFVDLYRQYYFGSGGDYQSDEIKNKKGYGYQPYDQPADPSAVTTNNNLIKSIDIITLEGNTGAGSDGVVTPVGQVMQLINPKLSTFTHTGHDHSVDDELTSFSLTFQPEAVRLKHATVGPEHMRQQEASLIAGPNTFNAGEGPIAPFPTPKMALPAGFLTALLTGEKDFGDIAEDFRDSEVFRSVETIAKITGKSSALDNALGKVSKTANRLDGGLKGGTSFIQDYNSIGSSLSVIGGAASGATGINNNETAATQNDATAINNGVASGDITGLLDGDG